MSVRKNGQVIAGSLTITISTHHVGEIFYTSRLDTELFGAVDADESVYTADSFTGNQSITALLTNNLLPYVSLEEYENILNTYGSCRAFGWNQGKEFRVPCLKDVYLMSGIAETAGEFIYEGYNGSSQAMLIMWEAKGYIK